MFVFVRSPEPSQVRLVGLAANDSGLDPRYQYFSDIVLIRRLIIGFVAVNGLPQHDPVIALAARDLTRNGQVANVLLYGSPDL